MQIKESFKRYWKTIILVLIIVLGFLFIYEVLPIYNKGFFDLGYDSALEDLSNSKAVPLKITQGNQTQIIPVGVCSDTFIQQYQNICGVSG